MSTSDLHAELVTVGGLFDGRETIYTVPAYQRNFAWGAEQIEQLISDIQSAIRDPTAIGQGGESGYFLGNLIVTDRGVRTHDFEVIDGQQRLTTLHLMLTFLASSGTSPSEVHKDRLRYQSRPRASEALRRIRSDSSGHLESGLDLASAEDTGIQQGFNIIRQYMNQHIVVGPERHAFADFLRDKVQLVRASLPRDTDLNRYFEVMNTRGQQLRQVDIVKARLMSRLGDEAERACFAWIWDACADMDSYVQVALAPRDPKMRAQLRTKVFGRDWSRLNPLDFAGLHKIHFELGHGTDTMNTGPGSTSLPLGEALEKYALVGTSSSSKDPDDVRFRSTIDFPSFLLHVLKVTTLDDDEEEGDLDDKRLVKRFVEVFESGGVDVRDFALTLLRCRVIFDSFVLKRQVTASHGDDGDWSLKRLRSKDGSLSYLNTFAGAEVEDGVFDVSTWDLLLIQSMLRVTYTSPNTMHWITQLLRELLGSSGVTSSGQLVELLRQYARRKVKEAYFDADEPTAFGVSRIVFTYLDYLLVTESRHPNFRFTYRNSIEHFYPQGPDAQMSGSTVTADWLHSLGNLALVSVGANSKFSNSLPMAKALNFKSTIEAQSPKLREMARITIAEGGWGDRQVEEHHDKMRALLAGDVAKLGVRT